ncbi:MAG: hypothetical protein MI747_12550, partial [Desulfobacterales bacterium]|nr:hypothetical protein [Desulfobacterales bacterium]
QSGDGEVIPLNAVLPKGATPLVWALEVSENKVKRASDSHGRFRGGCGEFHGEIQGGNFFKRCGRFPSFFMENGFCSGELEYRTDVFAGLAWRRGALTGHCSMGLCG